FDVFGNEIADPTFVWSSDPLIGSISQDGLLVASTTAGVGTVTATFGAINGSATVEVIPAEPDHLMVIPDPIEVVAGDHAIVTVDAYDEYGNEILGLTYLWATDAGWIVPVEGAHHSAVFIAGTVAVSGTLTVSNGTLAVQVGVDISPGPLDHIEVSPSEASVVAGTEASFQAAGYDVFGNEIQGLAFVWGASPALGTISQVGVLTVAEATCTGTVMASVASASAEVEVEVVPGAIAAISANPASFSIQAGSSAMVIATAVDEFGNLISSALISVGSERGALAVVREGSAYIWYVAPTAAGTDNITLSSGVVSRTVQVTVVPGALDRLVVSPANLSLKTDEEAVVSVRGVDIFGNPVSLGDVDWACSLGTIQPSQDGLSATFSSGDDGSSGHITIESGGMSATVPVYIDDGPRTLADDLTTGPALALLLLVIVLAAILLILFMKSRGAGGSGREPSDPGVQEPPQSGPGI
ncbi:MAG: hypothetical protein JW880_01005, partial [Candidatus Thermoplasmatota archaeon]|nr:hypothetical protein [Candidatus Thermoplasmatota archaeon]